MAEWGGKWCTQNKHQHTAIDRSFMRRSGGTGDAESRQSHSQSVDQNSHLLNLKKQKKCQQLPLMPKTSVAWIREREASKWMLLVLMKRAVVSQDVNRATAVHSCLS
jgi:hypothetical protein